jgi:phosphatidylserine/phosphatidylglycerophosphate/cardiolipin synthase-like enzyme
MPNILSRPVVQARNGSYTACALVGCHSVSLAWNIDDHEDRSSLLGFAIRRSRLDEELNLHDMRWLEGQKRFPGLENDNYGLNIPSYKAPFQRFRWNDYSVKPNQIYRFEIFPVTGQPNDIIMDLPIVLDFRTFMNSAGSLQIYTNRGVTSALAYYDLFKDKHPSEIPDGSAYRWLSRELKESAQNFIEQSEPGDEIHIAIYEFHDDAIANALSLASAKGVVIKVVYHAPDPNQGTVKKSLAIIQQNHLDSICIPRTKTKISHNKFMVLLRNQKPVQVWTGSANFSEAAFHFQTNFSVVITNEHVANLYEQYFKSLAMDLPRGRKNKSSEYIQDHIDKILFEYKTNHVERKENLYFSPIRSKEIVDVAVELIRNAKSAILLSSPFGMDKAIISAIGENSKDILEYGLANATATKKVAGLNKKNTRFFTPTRLETYLGRRWDAKMFGSHKIHAKSLIIDPWSTSPKVLFGSANFSEPSCKENDENMLLFENDPRLAAIMATEFLRMFDHYKSRWFINNFFADDTQQNRYLTENGDWSNIYFRANANSHKFRDRLVFCGK